MLFLLALPDFLPVFVHLWYVVREILRMCDIRTSSWRPYDSDLIPFDTLI